MTLWQKLSSDLRRLREDVQQMVSHVVRWTKVANTSPKGDADAVEYYDTDTDEPAVQLRVRRVSSWGLAGRPATGVLAAVVHALNAVTQGVMVGIASARYGRQDLEAGETQVYNIADGCEVWLDKDGAIHINASSGKDVIVNGGSLRVARATDTVKTKAALATWAGQVEGAITALGGTTPSPTFSTFANAIAEIADGAAHFKG